MVFGGFLSFAGTIELLQTAPYERNEEVVEIKIYFHRKFG